MRTFNIFQKDKLKETIKAYDLEEAKRVALDQLDISIVEDVEADQKEEKEKKGGEPSYVSN